MIIIANVILASHAAYMAMLFPLNTLLVLVSETAVFRFYQKDNISVGRSAWLVLAANVISWIAGVILISFLLPSGLKQWTKADATVRSPYYDLIALFSFVCAFVLSVLIEYGFYRLRHRRYHFERLWTCTVVANLASYLLLALGVFCLFYFHII